MATPDELTGTDGIEPQDIIPVYSRRNRDTRGVSFGEFQDGIDATVQAALTEPVESANAAAALAQAAADIAIGAATGSVKVSDLSSATGASSVGTKLGVTGAKQRTQQQVNGDIVNIRGFDGVDVMGIADSRNAFVWAQLAAIGRTLVAEGTFVIGSPLSYQSNTTCDFRRAKFIGGSGCSGQAIFWTVGKTDIEVIGGYSEMTANTPNVTIGTGTYTNFTFMYFENCSRVRVSRTSAKRMFTVLNFYNCIDCDSDENYTEDCNASFAAVGDPTGGRVGTACRNVNFRRNTIIRGGDDGIALLARGMDVVNCNADDNYITKTTRSNGELDGSTLAATGLRAGRFGASGNIVGGGFRRNTGLDMVTDFIRAHNSTDFDVLDNSCAGYAKMSVEACFQIGASTGYGFTRGQVRGNRATAGVLNKRCYYFYEVTNSKIESNIGIAAIGGDGTARFDFCVNNDIFYNTFHNTSAYGILLSANSTDNRVLSNDVRVYAALGIADLGNNNQIKDNKGAPTRSFGTSAVPAGAASKIVDHGLPALKPGSVPVITITPRGPIYSGGDWQVSSITSSQFTVTTTANPTTGNFDFSWIAEKI